MQCLRKHHSSAEDPGGQGAGPWGVVDAPEPLAEPAPGSGQDRASGQASRARPAAARSCLTASAKAPGAGTGAEEQPRERGVARPVARPPAGPGAHPSHGTPRQASLLAPPRVRSPPCVRVCVQGSVRTPARYRLSLRRREAHARPRARARDKRTAGCDPPRTRPMDPLP